MQVETMTQKRSNNTPAATGGSVIIPLQLRVSLEVPGEATLVAAPQPDRSIAEPTALEVEAIKLQMPIIYDGLDEREGFNRRFLNDATDVPMPKVTAAGRKLS